jgi:hypothetical protein
VRHDAAHLWSTPAAKDQSTASLQEFADRMTREAMQSMEHATMAAPPRSPGRADASIPYADAEITLQMLSVENPRSEALRCSKCRFTLLLLSSKVSLLKTALRAEYDNQP